jgi:hypothetical protein
MEHDSGIESNDHDSHSDLSPSQVFKKWKEYWPAIGSYNLDLKPKI